MYIMGISALYHDSAACLIHDGQIVAAVQEERFSRKKHDAGFPTKSIDYCLAHAGITKSDISYVAFYDKPLMKLERVLKTYMGYVPRGYKSFQDAISLWGGSKLFIKQTIQSKFGSSINVLFPEHHESHAMSAFYPSPFDEAAVLTIDGVGEWATTSLAIGQGKDLDILSQIYFPHSLGLLYSAFTSYLGFKVNSGEYKVMGLAPYGEPRFKRLIYDHLIDVKRDGSFQLNMDYFSFPVFKKMTNNKFDKVFGGAPRKPEMQLVQRDMDLARSIQEVTEEVVIKLARHARSETGLRNLCLAGGVALNCVANGRILYENIFDNLWIQPASGDAGGALGAALGVWHQYLKNDRVVNDQCDKMNGGFLGPEYSDTEIRKYLDNEGVPYTLLAEDILIEEVTNLISKGHVIGWFQGRMEFGPRSLGNRSIIGDPRSSSMQETMNKKIKFRESFRPFAPSVLIEKATDWFELNDPSPYMLLVAQVRQEKRQKVKDKENSQFGIDRLNVLRSDIPAVTHVDYSARIQTIDRKTNAKFHRLVSEFDRKYGCPVVVNTSFNVRGEPPVCTPEDAYRCFMRTNMDYLVLGNILLEKTLQPKVEKDVNWLKEFELD
ncbi:Nodulation protein nolO [hydrothermal vent metagenome]|uniref:Nodulation protein nolO n=1 Tax=hydrothermal vent metagenome TaxID=652676 RepID=A0A3B0Z8J0_9ZZZZ